MTRGFGRLRREDLLKTACEVIAAQGFGHTRTLDIARAAGVSQALLFYHFETKDQLFAQALVYAARRDLDSLAKLDRAGGTPVERLRHLLRLYSPTGSARTWRMWIDAWAESMRSADLEETSRRLDLRWKESLRAIVDEGVASGAFACADPDAATWRILSLVDGPGRPGERASQGAVAPQGGRAHPDGDGRELGIREEDLS
ncbi:TetR family transcriptional regulator C-terminal domain-containing protein [Nonomuraea dietziae]